MSHLVKMDFLIFPKEIKGTVMQFKKLYHCDNFDMKTKTQKLSIAFKNESLSLTV